MGLGSLRLIALPLVVATQAAPSGTRLVQVSVVVHDSRQEPTRPRGKRRMAGRGCDGAVSFPEAMREFLEDGMAVTRTITLRPDAHQVRVITRDVASSAVGSVIIQAADLR